MNSRSRKRRRSRPCSASYISESPRRPPTPFGPNGPLLRKRVSRARDPTRRLGGALAAQRAVSGRAWMVLAPCKKRRMLEVLLGQQEPLEQIASMSRAQSQHIIVTRTWCLDLASSRGPLYYLSPVPQGPLRRDWAGVRGDRRVAGRVRARVNSKNFTLTELTCWADGLWVKGRGVAAACHQDYFWANRGLVNAGEVRGRTKALFDRVGQFRHHGLYDD